MTNVLADSFHTAHIQLAVPLAWSSDAYEGNVRFIYCRNGIGSRMQATGDVRLRCHLLDLVLNDWGSSALERVNFLGIEVYADYAVAFMRKADCRYGSYVAKPKYAD
jgi:hypothetical protein